MMTIYQMRVFSKTEVQPENVESLHVSYRQPPGAFNFLVFCPLPQQGQAEAGPRPKEVQWQRHCLGFDKWE